MIPTGQQQRGGAASSSVGLGNPTLAELTSAARRAWRDEPRCIGRWRHQALGFRDARHLTDPAAVAANLAEHLREATGDGRIRSIVTILNPGIDIANEQLIGYAGYAQADDTLVGDPRHTRITDHALAAGWRAAAPRGRFDVLPLVISGPDTPLGSPASVHELPADSVREIPLHHPRHPWLADLGLRWYAVPALTSHALVLTERVAFPAVISGHYLSTEIACRDLADVDRYNALPDIAAFLGLDTSTPRNLWHARAELVLHEAVIHSFDDAGVRISDPITEADHYHRWTQKEQNAGRPIQEDWSWIVPPFAAARTAVYGRYLPEPIRALPAYRPRTSS